MPVSQTDGDSPPNPLRRVKRLALVVMLSILALDAVIMDPTDLAVDGRLSLAVVVGMVAVWAIVSEVATYLRVEGANRAANAQAARLEGARLTATAMQDRIANKLSLTVGYCEFLANDPRVPADLREQAELARQGAMAAAETVSELKRLTKESNNHNPAFLDGRASSPVDIQDSRN
jgi:hypothetical protein